MFYGIDRYSGADRRDSPTRLSQAVGATPAHENLPFNFVDHRQAFKKRPRHKAHIQFNGANDLELWARFTSGGEELRGDKKSYFRFNDSNSVGIAYRQLTAALQKKWTINDELQLKTFASYDIYDRIRTNNLRPRSPGINLREDEYMARLQLNWKPSDINQLALGTEFTYEEFGEKPFFFSESNTALPLPSNGQPWQTYMVSVFGEHQFRPNKEWRLISGLRLDIHKRIEPMVSPRVGLTYTPTENDTAKLILSRSLRRTNDFFSQAEYLNTRKKSKHVETLNNVEISYQRVIMENLKGSLYVSYSNLETIAFNRPVNNDDEQLTNRPLGILDFGNLELELSYQTVSDHFSISHSITQLFNFDLKNEVPVQFISASPYGFGNDFAAWSNHTTKFYWNHQFNQNFSTNISGLIYWGYRGAKDWARYNRDVLKPSFEENTTFFEDNDKAFKSSVFLNAGIQYKFGNHVKFLFTGHNLLGWIDKDFNKRNSSTQLGTYTLEAAAFSLRLDYLF